MTVVAYGYLPNQYGLAPLESFIESEFATFTERTHVYVGDRYEGVTTFQCDEQEATYVVESLSDTKQKFATPKFVVLPSGAAFLSIALLLITWHICCGHLSLQSLLTSLPSTVLATRLS